MFVQTVLLRQPLHEADRGSESEDVFMGEVLRDPHKKFQSVLFHQMTANLGTLIKRVRSL